MPKIVVTVGIILLVIYSCEHLLVSYGQNLECTDMAKVMVSCVGKLQKIPCKYACCFIHQEGQISWLLSLHLSLFGALLGEQLPLLIQHLMARACKYHASDGKKPHFFCGKHDAAVGLTWKNSSYIYYFLINSLILPPREPTVKFLVLLFLPTILKRARRRCSRLGSTETWPSVLHIYLGLSKGPYEAMNEQYLQAPPPPPPPI